jgi:hypothetical protein
LCLDKVFIVMLLQTNSFVFGFDNSRVVLVKRFGVPERIVGFGIT